MFSEKISCPLYEELDRVLEDRLSLCPDEGDELNFPSTTNINDCVMFSVKSVKLKSNFIAC